MKLDARQAARLLRDPGACRFVLLHGDDIGMVRGRGDALADAVIGREQAAFRLVTLDRADHPRLAEEASALSLIGGRRVVRIRDATDGLAAAIEAALERPGDALLVLESEALPTRSKLRTLAERRPDAASIACYAEEGRALETTLRDALAERGVGIDADALAWLSQSLGADQAATRGEAEKLALYVGQGGRVTLADAEACIGDAAALSLDDALFAATAGDAARADRALARAFAEGAASVSVLRAAASHLARLTALAELVSGGQPVAEAIRAARPPVFLRRQGAMREALSRWSPSALARAQERLRESEILCKRTGAREEAICGWALLGIARMAARPGRAPAEGSALS